MEDIVHYDFCDKSLEEIEKHYGKDISDGVYWCACKGIDLTKIRPVLSKTEDMVDFEVTETKQSLSLTLKTNKHCVATCDIPIFQASFTHDIDQGIKRHIISRAIWRLCE